MNKTSGLKTKSDFARIIAAAMVGNALEFYDLFICGFLAIVIAKVFFPAGSEFISLLIMVATFGASYIMRPLGAAVLGGYSDRSGQKARMMLTIWMMGIGVTLLGHMRLLQRSPKADPPCRPSQVSMQWGDRQQGGAYSVRTARSAVPQGRQKSVTGRG